MDHALAGPLKALRCWRFFEWCQTPGCVSSARDCSAWRSRAWLLNPAVFEYHPRTGTRIWNWYLYAYGLTSVCQFAGAWLVQKYRETLLSRVIPRLLYALGTVLTFLLLNIEIADFFSIGPTLTFSFSGNFARDMTYSIGWALFALTLLLVGMKRHMRFVRYAGLALLIITVAKLFLHDLIT